MSRFHIQSMLTGMLLLVLSACTMQFGGGSDYKLLANRQDRTDDAVRALEARLASIDNDLQQTRRQIAESDHQASTAKLMEKYDPAPTSARGNPVDEQPIIQSFTSSLPTGVGSVSEQEAKAMCALVSKAIVTLPNDKRTADDMIRTYSSLFINSAEPDSVFLFSITKGRNVAGQKSVIDQKMHGYMGALYKRSLGNSIFAIEIVPWGSVGRMPGVTYKLTLGRDPSGRVVILKDEK